MSEKNLLYRWSRRLFGPFFTPTRGRLPHGCRWRIRIPPKEGLEPDVVLGDFDSLKQNPSIKILLSYLRKRMTLICSMRCALDWTRDTELFIFTVGWAGALSTRWPIYNP